MSFPEIINYFSTKLRRFSERSVSSVFNSSLIILLPSISILSPVYYSEYNSFSFSALMSSFLLFFRQRFSAVSVFDLFHNLSTNNLSPRNPIQLPWGKIILLFIYTLCQDIQTFITTPQDPRKLVYCFQSMSHTNSLFPVLLCFSLFIGVLFF